MRRNSECQSLKKEEKIIEKTKSCDFDMGSYRNTLVEPYNS